MCGADPLPDSRMFAGGTRVRRADGLKLEYNNKGGSTAMSGETEDLALETFLPYRLNRAAAAVTARVAEVYRNEFGLTVPAWRVLAVLGDGRHESGLTATAIGRLASMHKTKVSRAVAALADRRWLERRVDKRDRRVEHLRLTVQGRTAYRQLVPRMRVTEGKLLTALGNDALALDRALTALESLLGLDNGGPVVPED